MVFAYVTMLTNGIQMTNITEDSYLPGALVLANSLRKSQTTFKIVILIAGNVSKEVMNICNSHFDKVVHAHQLVSSDAENLSLLGRPELSVTFSKIHVFNPFLFPYERVCFLDADVLVLKNIDDCFTYLDNDETIFTACPDIGWPDCFNTGVFVTKPDNELYESILSASERIGSFDGKIISF